METQNSFLPLRDLTEMTAPLNRAKTSMTDSTIDHASILERVIGYSVMEQQRTCQPCEEVSSSRDHSSRPEDRRNATIDGSISRGHPLQKMPDVGILFPSQQEGSKGL
jgi:hypothetical protein